MPNLSPEIARRVSGGAELRASILLGCDAVEWLEERHKAGRTWEEARDDLATETGVRVSIRTIVTWRNARAAA